MEATATQIPDEEFYGSRWVVVCKECGAEWEETVNWPGARAAFGTLMERFGRFHKCPKMVQEDS